jgi:hypothetical protein
MNDIREDYNLVTETYDEWDRLLYVNYFKTDVPYRSAINAKDGNIQFLDSGERRPKKLLYQDVYTYKEGTRRVAPAIRRVYQPVIDFSASRNGSVITLNGSFICRSKVLTSGFIWSSDPQSVMNEALMPPNYFKNSSGLNDRQLYRGANALGLRTHVINSASTRHIKAFVQIETGTLFSKTISV